MFCPNCATENSSFDVNFCRLCGKDLRLIEQAMVKRIGWRTVLASKLDDFFMGKSQRDKRYHAALTGRANMILGLTLIATGIVNMFTHNREYLFTGLLFFAGLLDFGIGFGNVWVNKRRLMSDAYLEAERMPDDLSIYKQTSAPAAAREKLPAANATSEISGERVSGVAPPSVTEHTTVSLKGRGK